MREKKVWENQDKQYNAEYQKKYGVLENKTTVETELAKYLSGEELKQTLATKNKAVHIIGLQGKTIRELFTNQGVVVLQFVEMQRTIKELFTQQGRSERIKDFPYPRQFSTIRYSHRFIN